MAGIVTGPGKQREHHSLKEVMNGDSTRHLVAIGLALVLVCMIVAALLLSANEGAASLN